MTLSAHFELVRVAPEILAKIEAEGSEPVHIIGIIRHEDGTLDMIFSRPDLARENERLRAAINEYSLWEPGRAGHAAAYRKLMEALR